MAAENARVDTTFIGYLLIGFILLMFGVLGLQWGLVFGDYYIAGAYKDMPLDQNVFFQVGTIIGLVLILLTIFAYRTGKQLSAGVFAFVGFFLIAMYFDNKTDVMLVSNSNWFMTTVFAIFFLILAIYAVVAKAPKFVAVLLLLLALMALFTSLGFFFDEIGPSYNVDVMKALYVVSAVFAFLGFIVSTYLGLAYANPKKVPLI